MMMEDDTDTLSQAGQNEAKEGPGYVGIRFCQEW